MYKPSVASRMGSGDWLKNIINLSKSRNPKSKRMKGFTLYVKNKSESQPQEKSTILVNGVASEKPKVVRQVVEDIAATRIQTAFRAFKARKALKHLKGVLRLQTLTKGDFGKKQTSNTLMNLQSWSKIQSQIRTRRLQMVEEEGIKRKKLENQLKLETKLRDLEVEWSGGSDTIDEALARIQHREEAALKRGRAMAYAFSHQWRPSSRYNLGPYDSEAATAEWGWSWLDRWIAIQPWENRVLVELTQKKLNSPANKAMKNSKSPSMKNSKSMKTSPNGMKTPRNRKLSYMATNKIETPLKV
ncbi:protein IQ-DOMAIN 9 isoform X2 [Lactuca sativa]|uniref:protein IQ-DOMAIN 9 isoform X2 n=1 Tax=Lactuca sativa TaxID=4236 RepID=UPI000CD91160|nr:protein IQ-DOMAIN 9 isoform X2 [Lactuca sativa]